MFLILGMGSNKAILQSEAYDALSALTRLVRLVGLSAELRWSHIVNFGPEGFLQESQNCVSVPSKLIMININTQFAR